MKHLSFGIMMLLLFGGCKLKDQPPATVSEKILFETIKKKCNCFLVERFFSESYLRYKKEGDYSLQISSTDSTALKKIETDCTDLVNFIDTAVLKNNQLIREINLHLIFQPLGKSYQNAKYLTFSRTGVGIQQKVED